MTKTELMQENSQLKRKIREIELSRKFAHREAIEMLSAGAFGESANYASGVFITIETLDGKKTTSVLIRDGLSEKLEQELKTNIRVSLDKDI